MAHLLLISLGPIQDFIDSARRCQDLWFGSWLLSDLARTVAKAVAKEAGGDDALIFPSSLQPNEQGRDAAIANKILLRVPEGKEPKEVAQAGKDALTKRLNDLMHDLFDSSRRLGNYFNRKLAEKQLHDMMEYIWVAVPEAPDYPSAREAAERLLARRKNTRTWGSFPWSEGVGIPKSSLDGVRESVLYEELYDQLSRLEGSDRGLQASALRQRYGLRGRERLCGVALLKRLGVDPEANLGDGRERPTFHSTGHIAAAPSLGRLSSSPKAQDAWSKLWAAWEAAGVDAGRLEVDAGTHKQARFTDLAGPNPFERAGDPTQPTEGKAPRTLQQDQDGWGLDASLLFEHENRIREVLDEAAPLETSADEKGRADRIKGIQKATREFLRAIEQSEAHPYYAFLLADGDRMGKALDYAGEEALQRRIAAALDGFSLECEGIVATHGGSLVYAGGDDVLALLPLHSALQCANALRLKFGEALAFLTKESATLATLERNAAKAEDKFQAPTLSVGLALAHHMDSMSEARRWAQDAEKLAKQERNSLAVAMHKRSGAILKVAGQWDVLFPLHERLAHWVHLLAHQDLPDRVAFEIEDALRIWEVSDPEKDAAKQGDPQASVASLLSRAVSRRRKDQGAGNTEIEKEPRDLLVSLFGDGQDAREAGRRLSAELQIARLFLEARNAAFGRIEGRSE